LPFAIAVSLPSTNVEAIDTPLAAHAKPSPSCSIRLIDRGVLIAAPPGTPNRWNQMI
jgi:hypothetical protein